MLDFAAGAMAVAEALPQSAAGKHITGQLIRSATSAGANYEEARGAESRADFVHKVALATKELRESVYWLGLVQARSMARLPPTLLREGDELTAILVASANTARKR